MSETAVEYRTEPCGECDGGGYITVRDEVEAEDGGWDEIAVGSELCDFCDGDGQVVIRYVRDLALEDRLRGWTWTGSEFVREDA